MKAKMNATKAQREGVQMMAIRAVALGSLCGLRSMMPLYLLARSLRLERHGRRLRQLLATAALGEVIADKTPLVSARIRALPMAGRACTGALAAAGMAFFRARPWRLPAVAGAAGALIAALSGYYLRKAATTRLALPDLPVAVAEDLVCLGLGYSLTFENQGMTPQIPGAAVRSAARSIR
jgi:hypothetical protein